MKITINRVKKRKPVRLEDFADEHGLEMIVNERELDELDVQRGRDNLRFYARFKGVQTKKGAMLTVDCGNGATPEEAISDYVPKIAGKRLVFDASQGSRREIDTPVSLSYSYSTQPAVLTPLRTELEEMAVSPVRRKEKR